MKNTHHLFLLGFFLLKLIAPVKAGDAAEKNVTTLGVDVTQTLLTKHHPIIACSPLEAGRLRQAWTSGRGPAFACVASRVKSARRALKQTITYPPRGGQHNQWYQCDTCEVALKTKGPNKHQCPKCQKIYSGYPYDDVLFARVHGSNLKKMSDAAWAGFITKEKPFADFAKTILLGYSRRYQSYPFHGSSKWNVAYNWLSGGHLFEQTLNEAYTMATRIAPAYDLVKASGVLTPEEDETIKIGLILPMLKNIQKNRMGKVNWQAWHNAGMLWGGAVLRQVDWVERAVLNPRHGFIRQMTISILPDGMWYEGSWGYHFYAQQALIIAAEGARQIGIDLWAQPQLRKTFIYPLAWRLPGDALPRFGDSVSPRLSRNSRIWEPAWHAYGDKRFLPMLMLKPTWESVFLGRKVNASAKPAKPDIDSTGDIVFEQSGHAILRRQGPAALSLAVTFGPHGGYHGHYDKLGFVLYAFGQELAVDPGRAASQAYRLPIHKQWYKASISHNVVLVDGVSQRPCRGKLLLHKKNIPWGKTTASLLLLENNHAYPGIKHSRLLLLTDHYLILMDLLASKTRHQYDWLYHNRGQDITPHPTFPKDQSTSAIKGMQYLKDIRVNRSADLHRFNIVGQKLTTHVICAPGPATDYLIATGPGASINQRIPMLMVRRQGKTAAFATVIEPVTENLSPTVQSITWSTPTTAVIKTKNSTHTFAITDTAVVIDRNRFNVKSQ